MVASICNASSSVGWILHASVNACSMPINISACLRHAMGEKLLPLWGNHVFLPMAEARGFHTWKDLLRRSRRWHARGLAGYHRRYTQVSAVVCPNVYTRATAMWSLPAALEGAGGITADTP